MVLLSVIFLAISAAATNYTVPYAAEAPAIDGVIDKVYMKCSPIDISTPAPGSVAEGHSTGTAYFAYDVNYLYLIVDVIDDTPCPPKGSNGDKMSSYDGILFAYNYTGETVEIGSSEGVF